MRDLDRQAYLTAAGWQRILRFPKEVVLREPERIPLTVRRELMIATSRTGERTGGVWCAARADRQASR